MTSSGTAGREPIKCSGESSKCGKEPFKCNGDASRCDGESSKGCREQSRHGEVSSHWGDGDEEPSRRGEVLSCRGDEEQSWRDGLWKVVVAVGVVMFFFLGIVVESMPARLDAGMAENYDTLEVSDEVKSMSLFIDTMDYVSIADRMLDNCEYENAIEAYKKALREESEDARKRDIYMSISHCYISLDDKQKALEYAEKAIRTDSLSPRAISFYCFTVGKAVSLEEGLKAMNAFVLKFAGSDDSEARECLSDVYYSMSLIYDKTGNHGMAKIYRRKCADLGASAASYREMGYICGRDENYDEAIEYYSFSIEMDLYSEFNVRSHVLIGTFYGLNEQYDEAYSAYKASFDIAWGYYRNENRIEMIRDEMYGYAVAASSVLAMLSTSPEDKVRYYEIWSQDDGISGFRLMGWKDYWEFATAYEALGDKEGAKRALRAGLDKYPDDSDLMFCYSLQLEDDDPETIPILEKILEKEDSVVPYVFDYATVYNNIGWAYCCQGRYSEGLPYAEKFVAMNPDDDYSWEMIGEIYYYLGRYDDCIDAMTKSLEFPVCHYEEYARSFLGEAYVKLGEKEKGEEELKRAAELRNASAGGQVAAVDSVKVYLPDSVDEQPQFVGGTDARRRYIAEKVIYPSEEKERGHQGTVVVSLIVERDGSISEVRVEEGVCPTLSHEAAEVVRCMPAWEPGTIDGVPVRVRLTLPVTFALQ